MNHSSEGAASIHRFANISELKTTEHIALAESVVFGQPPSQPAPRIASLVPSLTELVSALGLGPQLVARTGYCIHPADSVRSVPKVGGTKDVNLAKLQGLRPTHVLVNMDENRRETVDAIRAWPPQAVPQIVVTHPLGPEDNLALVAQLAACFAHVAGVREHAAALTAALQHELVQTRADDWPEQRVLYLIWREPWMTVARDTYLSRMLSRVNLADAARRARRRHRRRALPGGDAATSRGSRRCSRCCSAPSPTRSASSTSTKRAGSARTRRCAWSTAKC